MNEWRRGVIRCGMGIVRCQMPRIIGQSLLLDLLFLERKDTAYLLPVGSPLNPQSGRGYSIPMVLTMHTTHTSSTYLSIALLYYLFTRLHPS